jgi:hypothetical protein
VGGVTEMLLGATEVSDSRSTPYPAPDSPLTSLLLLLLACAGRRQAPRPIGLDYIYGTLSVRLRRPIGAVAQLGERLICIQEVAGSIPTSSTS